MHGFQRKPGRIKNYMPSKYFQAPTFFTQCQPILPSVGQVAVSHDTRVTQITCDSYQYYTSLNLYDNGHAIYAVMMY